MRLMNVALTAGLLLCGDARALENDTPKAEHFLAEQNVPTKIIVGTVNGQGIDYSKLCVSKDNIISRVRAALMEKAGQDHSLQGDKVNTVQSSVKYFLIACSEKNFSPQ